MSGLTACYLDFTRLWAFKCRHRLTKVSNILFYNIFPTYIRWVDLQLVTLILPDSGLSNVNIDLLKFQISCFTTYFPHILGECTYSLLPLFYQIYRKQVWKEFDYYWLNYIKPWLIVNFASPDCSNSLSCLVNELISEVIFFKNTLWKNVSSSLVVLELKDKTNIVYSH